MLLLLMILWKVFKNQLICDVFTKYGYFEKLRIEMWVVGKHEKVYHECILRPRPGASTRHGPVWLTWHWHNYIISILGGERKHLKISSQIRSFNFHVRMSQKLSKLAKAKNFNCCLSIIMDQRFNLYPSIKLIRFATDVKFKCLKTISE